MKFRKKPVVIEAIQFTGLNQDQILDWANSKTIIKTPDHYAASALLINTLEGQMTALPGDWIIKGVKGEFYPCKHDIFSATYEQV